MNKIKDNKNEFIKEKVLIELENKYIDFSKRINKFYKFKIKNIPIKTIKVMLNDLDIIIAKIKKHIEDINDTKTNSKIYKANLDLTVSRLDLTLTKFLKIRAELNKIKDNYYKNNKENKNQKNDFKNYKSTKEVNDILDNLKEIKDKSKEYLKLQQEIKIKLDLNDDIEIEYKKEDKHGNKLRSFLNKNISILKNYNELLKELNIKKKELDLNIEDNYHLFNNDKFTLKDNKNDSFYFEIEEKEKIIHNFLDFIDLYEELKQKADLLFELTKFIGIKTDFIFKDINLILENKNINIGNVLENKNKILLFLNSYNINEILLNLKELSKTINQTENLIEIKELYLTKLKDNFNLNEKEEDYLKEYLNEINTEFYDKLKELKEKTIHEIFYKQDKTKNNSFISILEEFNKYNEEISYKTNKIKEIFDSFKSLIIFIDIFEDFDDYIGSKLHKINDFKINKTIKDIKQELYDKYDDKYEKALDLIQDFSDVDYVDIKDYDNIIKYANIIDNILDELANDIKIINIDIKTINKAIRKINNYDYYHYDDLSSLKSKYINGLNFIILNNIENIIESRLSSILEDKYHEGETEYELEQISKKLLYSTMTSSSSSSSYSSFGGFSSGSSYSSSSSSFGGGGSYGGSSSF